MTTATETDEVAQTTGGPPEPTTMSHRQIMEALSGLLLGLFAAIVSSTIVSAALPKIIGTIGGGQTAYSWVVTAALLAMTATTPLWGKLADLYNKKRLVQIALLIFVAGSLVAGFSQNAGMLIACRAVQGVGAGGLSALAQIVMAAMIAPRERGRYSGYLGATFAMATVGGPLLGGVITDTSWLGWRWCFYVGVPFALIALIVLQKTLNLPVVRRQVKVDWPGAFLVTSAVCLLLVWVSFAGKSYDWLSTQTAVMVAGSLVLAVLFVLVELRATEPIVPMRLFRNRTITLASATSLLVGVAMFAGTVFFNQYFQLARGKSPTMSGFMTIPLIGGLFIASTVSGRIITRTGRWKAWLVCGGVLISAGLGLLGTIAYDTDYRLVAVYMAFMGLGIGMMMQNLVLCTQNQVAPQDLGAASSLVAFFRSLGGAAGVSILGAVMASQVSSHMRDGVSQLAPSDAKALAGMSSSEIPDVSTLPGPVRTLVEESYGHGISDIFLYVAPIAFVAFLLTLFIKEVALRTTSVSDAEPAPALAASAVTTTEPLDASPADVGVPERRFDDASISGADAYAASASDNGATTGVHGHVRSGDGAVLPGAALTLISPTGRQVGRAIAHRDGRFALDVPQPGSYVLIASSDGYQPQAAPIAINGHRLDYDFALSGMSGLSGTLRAADDATPVADAVVIVTDARGEVMAAGSSGPDGAYHLADLIPGPVTVAVNADAFQPVAVSADVAAHGTTRLDLVLSRGARLHGIVRGAHGPLRDARVTLVDPVGAVVATATTGADGDYTFTNLDNGDYTVIATGYPEASTTVVLRSGDIDGHDIELSYPDGSASRRNGRPR